MYILSALLPVILLIGYIVLRDHSRPEPPMQLVRGFVYGIVSALVALAIDSLMEAFGLYSIAATSGLDAMWNAFVMAALPEETAKLLMLWLLLRHNRYFDEHLDGVVYAACVGLGFAALENVLYVVQSGDSWALTAIVRGLLAVPAHFFFAVLMGYYYSLVHFGHKRRQNQALVLAAPVLAHGIYDTLAMTSELSPVFGTIFFITLLLFCFQLGKLCQRHISSLADADRRKGYQ